MGDAERRDALARLIPRLLAFSVDELLRVTRDVDTIERDRKRQFEELRIPVEGEHRAELEDLDAQVDANDVIHLDSVEDYDEWYLRNYGGEG